MKLLPIFVALSLLVGCSSAGRQVVVLTTTMNEIGSEDAAGKSVSVLRQELDLQLVFGERDVKFLSWTNRRFSSSKPEQKRWLKFLNGVRRELHGRFGVTLEADVVAGNFGEALRATLNEEGFMPHSIDDENGVVSSRDKAEVPTDLFTRQVWNYRSTLFSRR